MQPHFERHPLLPPKPGGNPGEASTRWRATPLLVAALLLSIGIDCEAAPLTHPRAVATWDTRASSIALGTQTALGSSLEHSATSLTAAFSSTGGHLSAQFSAHSVDYRRDAATDRTQGFALGGIALVQTPLGSSGASGLPKVALSGYGGLLPTVLIGGEFNAVTVPILIGAGLTFNVASRLGIHPWIELSPSWNFESELNEVRTTAVVQSALDGTLTTQEVRDLVEEGIRLEERQATGVRLGADASIRLAARWDLQLSIGVGNGASGRGGVSGAVVWRWDDWVGQARTDAAPRTVEEVPCDEIEARFKNCPAARQWYRRPTPSAGPGRATPGKQ